MTIGDKNMSNDMIERMKKKSCDGSRIKVNGEMYVNKNRAKTQKMMLGTAQFLAVAAILTTGISITSTMDFATEIRKEVAKTVNAQSFIGGGYYSRPVYDEKFIDYISDLTDFEVKKLFNQTMDEIDSYGEAHSISSVVTEMEKDYLESLENVNVR